MSITQLGWSVAKVVAPIGLIGALAVHPILPWPALAAACAAILLPSTRANRRRGARATRRWQSDHGFPPLPVTHHKVNAVAYQT